MRHPSLSVLFLAAAAIPAQQGSPPPSPAALTEQRVSTRLGWIAGYARSVELRIDYGVPQWRESYEAEFTKKSPRLFRLGSGGWATMHLGAELLVGKRKLPAGIYYLALHRSEQAKWSLAVLEPARLLRQGVLPGAVAGVKPALLVPLQPHEAVRPEPNLALALRAGAEVNGERPSPATLSIRWGPHELRAQLAIHLEPQERDVDTVKFRRLDERKAVTTASGLRYERLRTGIGNAPSAGDKATVNYVGWLDTGKKFDSSLDRAAPTTFGLRQVIKGWSEGLQQMAPGSVFLLEIPPDLGYGARGAGAGIPPNATLYFWIELLDVPDS
ncbi:MAG: FKBP-type peptidyl-prolyl cis-trans isomerase [Planctomycetota bacterium]